VDKAIGIAKAQIASIHKKWKVDSYPNFLKSCFMHRSSWEILKYKYLDRMLDSIVSNSPKKFVASFSGSSVTAGHDSKFNVSTSEVVGEFMKSPFSAMNITFESRNVALGNNPCVPYDVCIKFFAGLDADIVHWEQNYFCDGRNVVETFVRQAMTIPTKPVIVFSESSTGHWQQDQCKTSPHVLTEAEKKLLKMSPMELVSEGNKDEYHRAWGFVAGISKLYHGAAIQTFQHEKHTDYACLGPYIKNWSEGAASWHPSVIGHRLRASHHAYFWLLIYVDALEEMKKVLAHRSPEAALKDVRHHADTLYHPMPSTAKHQTPFVDNMTCHTDYQPRSIQSASLKSLVLSGLASEEPVQDYASSGPGWHYIIYEDIVDKHLVQRSKLMGYLDYKYLLYSGESSGPLSLKLDIESPGPVFICQTPGIWGALPKGFSEMWSADLQVYITHNVVNASKGFEFNKENAKKSSLSYDKHGLELCVQLKFDGNKVDYPAGHHVLTLLPSTHHRIIFAWLLHT
jgi:hypothetical protein